MNLENMTTNKFYNILCNLNDMEAIYLERFPKERYYENLDTYHRFLKNYFITKNNLSEIYFPKVEENDIEPLNSLKDLERLSEVQQVMADLDFSIGKQFNFPCNFLHKGSCYECIYVMEGSAKVQIQEKTLELENGDFVFHAPGDPYAVNASPNSIVINLNIRKSYIIKNYNALFAQCAAARLFFEYSIKNEATGAYLLFHTENQVEFRDIILKMFMEHIWGDFYRNEIIRANFELLVSYLKRYAKTETNNLKKMTSADKVYIDIMEYVSKHYMEATLESVAENVHFSKQYVARIIRQKTGNSFTKMMKTIRVEKIKQYLQETTLSLERIAELTGFSNTSYLWRTFKELTGQSPSEYRNDN